MKKKKNKLLEKRMMMYSISSGAFLFGANSVNAGVVYTNPADQSNLAQFTVDFDDNGTTDLHVRADLGTGGDGIALSDVRVLTGKPLLETFEEIPEPQYINSWEEITGNCGMHPPGIQRDPIAEQAALQQLIELGYIEKPDENITKNIERTIQESKFYLARVYINKNKFSEALPILEDLHQKQPGIIRYAYTLAKCLDSLGRIDEALVIVKKIIQNEKQEYPQLLLLQGTLEFTRKNYEKALEYIDKALKADPKLPQLYQQLGFVYLKMRRRSEAEAAFYKALENDPENPKAYYGLALINLRKKEYEKSIDYALNAVGLLYHYPHAHQVLGIAFAKVGMYERAAQALEIAVKIRPGFLIAHKYLSYIYSFKLKNIEKADYHIDEIKRLRTMMEEQTK